MRLLKKTIEEVTFSETEAKDLIEDYRVKAEQGYTVTSAGYTYKTKKAKGEIIAECWVVKVVLTFGELWEELVNE